MYSFYGGRPGNSFIIITTYRSIADMVTKFKQGPNYTAVHYDEHVMINTVNKNDPDNGKIYRRGYDFTNDMGGAEFIGTIVGPAGRAPLLEMTTVADVKKKQSSQGYEQRRSSGQYSVVGGNLVPGKTATGFNDKITWECCSIRNQNNEDTTAYIGFIIPYTVIDYQATSVEPYYNGSYADNTSATRIDDQTHPFFEKWNINIPKGVKGNAFMNLKVEAASINIQDYDGRTDDINNNRAVIAYDYYNYDRFQNGNPVRLYLGDYNMIEDVSFDDEGTLTIQYTHDDDKIFNKQIKWVKSVALNTETGLFTVIYNHTTDASGNPTTYTTYLDWINEVNIADDGTVTFGHTHNNDTVFDKKIQWCTGASINNDGTITFTWNNGTQDTIFRNLIKWISSVNLSTDGTLTISYNNGAEDSVFSQAIKWITDVQLADDGTFTIIYNNNASYVASQKLRWINNVELDTDGTLTIKYNNGNDTVFDNMIRWPYSATLSDQGTLSLLWNDNAIQVLSRQFKWISNVIIDNDGTVRFKWNNNDSDIVFNNLMRWITSISINTGLTEGTGNQKINISWNDGTSQDIGNPINYVMNMAVNDSNHLLVRYSDPNRRAGGLTYNNIDGWTDLGQIFQKYEYNPNDTVSGLSWKGIGTIEDYTTGNKKIFLTINLNGTFNPQINNITINAGNIIGEGATTFNLNLSSQNTTIEKTLTGLQFEIDSGIPSDSPPSSNVFINLSISDMELYFTTISPQGG